MFAIRIGYAQVFVSKKVNLSFRKVYNENKKYANLCYFIFVKN